MADDDAWDYLDAYKLLDHLPEKLEGEEGLGSKKWSDRKGVLDELKATLDKNPKLDPNAHYHELVSSLAKVMGKDSNIMCVAAASYCLAGIAGGLRKKFGPLINSAVPVILEKFKERKAVAVEALKTAIDAIFTYNPIDTMVEDFEKALGHKSPGVKVQTSLFLSRHFPRLNKDSLPKKILKPLADALVKVPN